MTVENKRIVVGISGASGAIYGLRFLMSLPSDYEVYLVISETAKRIMKMETGWDGNTESLPQFLVQQFSFRQQLAPIKQFTEKDHFAPIASGSFAVRGMVVIPASMKTVSAIANGYADNLLERAADVNLKERRPLILVVRETPLHKIHLQNMLNISEAGGVIVPAAPAFYQKPQTILDLADFIVGRVFNLLQIPHNLFKPWGTTKSR